MSFADIFQRMRHGLELIAAWPLRWFGIALLLLLIVEPLVLLPVAGFTLKVVLTALFAAALMPVFAGADRGEPPRLAALFGFYRTPLSGLLALIVAAVIPFAAALALLAWQVGPDSVDFFFGSALSMDPPSQTVFQRFKISLYLFSMPFVFVPVAVTLKGLGGWAALRESVRAAAVHWRVPVLFFLFSFAYELLMARLPEFFPLVGVIVVAVLLVPFFVIAMLAFTYELGKVALNVAVEPEA